MASHNLARVEIDGLEIIGYSVAGEETVVAIPQLDVCFDAGKAPDQIIPINNLLLSHGHMDHSAGVAYYLSHRNFCGMPAGTIVAPEKLLGPIRQIIEATGRLDGNPVPANLVGVKVGEEYQIKPNLVARVFPTKHGPASVGYTVIEKRKKLKEEFVGLTGPQIVELKKQGIAIDYPVEIPIVSYLGDTQYVDLSSLDYVRHSRILITECTFYTDEHIERAKAGRHTHVNEFGAMLEKLENEHVVVIHTTQRTPIRDARKRLREMLPPEKYEKIVLLMEHWKSR